MLERCAVYHVWERIGVTCIAVMFGPVQAVGPPAVWVGPARQPASSDTAVCFWSWTALSLAYLLPWKPGTRKRAKKWEQRQWCYLHLCCQQRQKVTCNCGVSMASNSRLRVSWLFFSADGALSWWELRYCKASWAPSLVWNLSTIWLANM